MDVTEPSLVPAEAFASPGGFADSEIMAIVDGAADATPLLAAGVTAYDPEVDVDGSMFVRYMRISGHIAISGATLS